MRIAYARHEEMTEIDNVHDSADPILFKRLFENEGFQTPWRLIHAAIIPPDGGIGHHCHNNCEQIIGGAAVSPTPRRITRYMQSYNSRDSIFLILMSL